MNLQPGDICITGVEHSAECFVILAPADPEGRHRALSLKKRAEYLVRGGLHKIGAVAPEVGLEGIKALVLKKIEPPALDSEAFVLGQLRAEYVWNYKSNSVFRSCWLFPIDKLRIRRGGGARSCLNAISFTSVDDFSTAHDGLSLPGTGGLSSANSAGLLARVLQCV